MDIKMDPMTTAFLISAITDLIITFSARANGVSVEEMKEKISTLQPKADMLEEWLRGKSA